MQGVLKSRKTVIGLFPYPESQVPACCQGHGVIWAPFGGEQGVAGSGLGVWGFAPVPCCIWGLPEKGFASP